jgi:DNA-binding CsgD family transcriptional regulator
MAGQGRVPQGLRDADCRSINLAEQDLLAVARLWDELSEFPASRTDAARDHCLHALAGLIGACGALWVGASRADECADDDRMRGWRPRAVRQLHMSDEREHRSKALLARMKVNVVDPQTEAILAQAGRTRAFLRRELVDDETWRGSYLYREILRPLGVEDRLLGARAVDDVSESYVGLDRGPSDPPFAARERDVLYLFLHGAPSFHREQLLAHGIGPALSPREREVMALLLTDQTEREIAHALGLTWRSTHQYVVSIARKLGVKGRVGVMSWWLRHRGPASGARHPAG